MNSRLHNRILALAAGALATFIVAPAAMAQFTINFDENGNARAVDASGAAIPIPSLGNQTDPLDPGNGMKPLTYDIGAVFPGVVPTPGDVELFDPQSPTQDTSDVLRWEPPSVAGGARLVVYSDAPEAGEITQLADVGLPTFLQPNQLHLPEIGPETGPNGLVAYMPTPNQPGAFPAGAVPVTYNFLSDPAVPEPSTVFGVFMVAGILLLRRHRRPHLSSAA